MGLPGAKTVGKAVTKGASVLASWGAGLALMVLGNRIDAEFTEAKNARLLEQLRVEMELTLKERLSVLKAAKGESAEWINEVQQSVWVDIVVPVLTTWLPPIVDAGLRQVIDDKESFEVPDFVQNLRLKTLDFGTKSPRLKRVTLPDTRADGTLPPGDTNVDFDVEFASDMKIEMEITLVNAVGSLVSRVLKDKERNSKIVLTVSDIQAWPHVRARFRPGAQTVFLSLLSFDPPPKVNIHVRAVDFTGVGVSLPVTALPGVERFVASLVRNGAEEVMLSPERFVPVDLSPILDILLGVTRAPTAVPVAGSLKVAFVELVGAEGVAVPKGAAPGLAAAVEEEGGRAAQGASPGGTGGGVPAGGGGGSMRRGDGSPVNSPRIPEMFQSFRAGDSPGTNPLGPGEPPADGGADRSRRLSVGWADGYAGGAAAAPEGAGSPGPPARRNSQVGNQSPRPARTSFARQASGRSDDGSARPSSDAWRGARPFCVAKYGAGKKRRTGPAKQSAEPRIEWAESSGVLSLDMMGPADIITIKVNNSGAKVLGSGGEIGEAHFKVFWHPDGSATYYTADTKGEPIIVRGAHAARRNAGTLYSGRHGYADMWLPLWLDGAPTGALLRVQMQAEWFGALKALTPAEETAVVLLQRALRRFRERRRRAEELRSLSFGLFSTQAEAAVSVLRAANVPRKAGYFVLVQALGPPQGELPGQVLASFKTAVVQEEDDEPSWGEDFTLAVDATQHVSQVRVALHRMPKRFGGAVGPGEKAEVGAATLLGEWRRDFAEVHPKRGAMRAVWAEVGGKGLDDLWARMDAEKPRETSEAEARERQKGQARGNAAVLLYFTTTFTSAK